MAHRIVWSKRAARDLDSIIDYIATDSPAYAGIVLKNTVNQARILARFPRGRRLPERRGRVARGDRPLPHWKLGRYARLAEQLVLIEIAHSSPNCLIAEQIG